MFLIPLGDVHSVNIELLAPLARAAETSFPLPGQPIVIIGSAWQWQDQLQRLGQRPLALAEIRNFESAEPDRVSFLDIGTPSDAHPAETLDPSVRGALALRALESLRTLRVDANRRLAVLTGSIDKQACHQAGFGFPGQTEFFASLWQAEAIMVLAGPRLRVGLVTNHLALASVTGALNQDLVATKVVLFAKTLHSVFGVLKPRLAVCGVNPHAGDGGLFGNEEASIITPALAMAAQELKRVGLAVDIAGPLAADTIFYRAYRGDFDGVLAMYHDQGLGPLKTVHFDNGVNLSGGLPHLRVSPDHGPARDLFLQRRASPASWNYAFQIALNYLKTPDSGAAYQ